MTPDPRDELPALNSTPRAWTRADTDALLDTALARLQDFDDTAFLPPTTEETERLRTQRETVGRNLVWDNIAAMYQRMLTSRPIPTYTPSEEAAHALAAHPRATQPALITEHPFPIRFAPDVWEQLHPIDENLRPHHPRQTLYLTHGRATTRR